MNQPTKSNIYFQRGIKSLKAGILVLIAAIIALLSGEPMLSLVGTIIGIALTIAGIIYFGKYKQADREASRFDDRKN